MRPRVVGLFAVGLIASLLLMPWPSSSANSCDANAKLCAAHYRFTYNKNPKDFGDWIRDGLDNPLVKSTLEAAATYFGAPGAVGVLDQLTPKAPKKGHDGADEIVVPLPKGHVFCNGKAHMTSTLGRGSLVIRGYRDYFEIVLWLKERNFTQGRSRIELTTDVVSIKAGEYERYLAEGKCTPHPTFLIRVAEPVNKNETVGS